MAQKPTGLSRRNFCRGIAGAAGLFPVAANALVNQHYAAPLMMPLAGVLGSSTANAAAFFPVQAGASSNFFNGGNKPSQFPNVPFSQSVAGSVVTTLLPELLSDIPVEGMRLFTQHAGPIADFFSLTIYPPGTMLTTTNGVTAWGLPMLRLKVATSIGLATFVAMLPRWDAGVWQLLVVLLNDVTQGLRAGVTAYQFLKDQRSPQLERLSVQAGYPNLDRPTSTIVNVPMNIPVGMTGFGSQLDITIGRIPYTYGPGAQGSLVNTSIGSVTYSPFAADPNYTLSNVVDLNTGAFIKPGFGAPNLFTPNSGYSPVALIGEGLGDGLGFMRNYGILNNIPLPEGVFSLDTRFGNSGTNFLENATPELSGDPFGP
jgi:hypothetical protein